MCLWDVLSGAVILTRWWRGFHQMEGKQALCFCIFMCNCKQHTHTFTFFFFLDLTIQYLDMMKCYKFPFVYDAMICSRIHVICSIWYLKFYKRLPSMILGVVMNECRRPCWLKIAKYKAEELFISKILNTGITSVSIACEVSFLKFLSYMKWFFYA